MCDDHAVILAERYFISKASIVDYIKLYGIIETGGANGKAGSSHGLIRSDIDHRI
jgi:hypothetical protein